MSVPLIHEDDAKRLDLPGRYLSWVCSPEVLNAKYGSVCVTRVKPGETVRPAHSHPNGEEVIYVISGAGRVMVDGEVDALRPGTLVLFRQGSIHQVQNNGTEELKLICFFSPPSDLSTYKFFEDVKFPD
jgi:quercetin dioxygenase-like cupin family protein